VLHVRRRPSATRARTKIVLATWLQRRNIDGARCRRDHSPGGVSVEGPFGPDSALFNILGASICTEAARLHESSACARSTTWTVTAVTRPIRPTTPGGPMACNGLSSVQRPQRLRILTATASKKNRSVRIGSSFAESRTAAYVMTS
jgi:hypothetical protein